MWSLKCGVWSEECRVCTVWSVERRVCWSVECCGVLWSVVQCGV